MPDDIIDIALPSGVSAQILTRGASLHTLRVPDRDGRLTDILAGPMPDDVVTPGYFGATVGRFANRIAGGGFTLGGTHYDLAVNEGTTCLHGGVDGFDRREWTVAERSGHAVTLTLTSPDGDQGFPGEVQASVRYAFDPDHPARLMIDMEAQVSAPTPISMTNHAYFNLGGVDDPAAVRAVDDHLLQVEADRYLPTDAAQIPLASAPAPVENTPFDFRASRAIGDGLRRADPQLLIARGYDHCLCLTGEGFRQAARLSHPGSGRRMTLWTDQPGLQLYTGNGLDGRAAGKNGVVARQGDAVCLEPGAWPDSPNRPDFPSSIVLPGEVWRHRMALVFDTI